MPPSAAKETPYLHTPLAALISLDPSYEALIDHASLAKGYPPYAKSLHKLHDSIATLNKLMTKRGEVCDRSMRQLVQRRKERLQEEREQEATRAEAARAIAKREEEAARKEKRVVSNKRTRDEMDVDAQDKDETLPSVGAHGLARQDGVGVHQGESAVCFSLASLHVLVCSHWLATMRISCASRFASSCSYHASHVFRRVPSRIALRVLFCLFEKWARHCRFASPARCLWPLPRDIPSIMGEVASSQ